MKISRSAESSISCKAAVLNIRVATMLIEYPDKLLSREQADLIRTGLITGIDEIEKGLRSMSLES